MRVRCLGHRHHPQPRLRIEMETPNKCKFKPVHTERLFLYIFVVITMFNSCYIKDKVDSIYNILQQQEVVTVSGSENLKGN